LFNLERTVDYSNGPNYSSRVEQSISIDDYFSGTQTTMLFGEESVFYHKTEAEFHIIDQSLLR
jgi:hypothetical protein